MILAKARLIEGTNGIVRVGLSFPTGFEPDEVVRDSVVANGSVTPQAVRVDPRRGTLNDIYREFEVTFPSKAVSQLPDGTLRITGRFRRGLPFTALVSGLSRPATDH